MALRESFREALQAAMKAGQPQRTSTLRMILAGLKDIDIAARPGPPVSDAEIVSMLRRMVKSCEESKDLYRQGNRQDLVEKETADINVIEEFLPPEMNERELAAAVEKTIGESGATSLKDIGKVMAALKAGYGGRVDLGRASALVKERLSR